VAISYSPLLLALAVLLHHLYGVSIASIKLLLTLDFPLYSQALSNISMLMAAITEKISLECSRLVTGLSSGSFTILEPFQVVLIVLEEDLSAVKKSLLLNIQVVMTLQRTQELL
jgi:hypothetical protein